MDLKKRPEMTTRVSLSQLTTKVSTRETTRRKAMQATTPANMEGGPITDRKAQAVAELLLEVAQ
jgi:hypothetical protein